jgi:hypothetical protein
MSSENQVHFLYLGGPMCEQFCNPDPLVINRLTSHRRSVTPLTDSEEESCDSEKYALAYPEFRGVAECREAAFEVQRVCTFCMSVTPLFRFRSFLIDTLLHRARCQSDRAAGVEATPAEFSFSKRAPAEDLTSHLRTIHPIALDMLRNFPSL